MGADFLMNIMSVVCECIYVDVRELRQAKMQLWTHDRCSQPGVWGRAVRNDSQLCAGYTSGFITACNVSTASLSHRSAYP